MTIGERIRKLRRELDLTQQEFCQKIGLQRNSISLVESGKRNISNQAILSICREFKANEAWLRNGEGEMFTETDSASVLAALKEEYGLPEAAMVMIEKFIQLKAPEREAVLKYAISVAQSLAPDIIDPHKATKEEKIEAYREYLDRQEETGGKSSASNF